MHYWGKNDLQTFFTHTFSYHVVTDEVLRVDEKQAEYQPDKALEAFSKPCRKKRSKFRWQTFLKRVV